MTAGLIRDAVMKGYKAQFITMDSLIKILRMKDSSSSAICAYNKMLKCQLLGIDDIMLMPMKKEEAVAFFNQVNYPKVLLFTLEISVITRNNLCHVTMLMTYYL